MLALPTSETDRRAPLHNESKNDLPRVTKRVLPLLFTFALFVLAEEATAVSSVTASEHVPAGADIDDLTLIPANGRGFLSVRVADLWRSPAVRQALTDVKKHDPKSSEPVALMEKEFGLKPLEVERVSAVYSDTGLVWVIVHTVKPYDERKILSRLKGARRFVHRGKNYYTGADQHGREAGVWPASPRILVVGLEEGVKGCITLTTGPAPKGPLEEIIARCKEKHHIVAGIDGKRLDGVKGNLLLAWVTPIERAWATVNVTKGVDFAIHAQAVDEKQAKTLQRSARASLRLTPEFLASKIDVGIAGELSSLVSMAKAEQKGREVIIRGSDDDPNGVFEAAILLACRSPSLMKEEGQVLEVRSPFGVHRVEDGNAYIWEVRQSNGKSRFCTYRSQLIRLLRDSEGSKTLGFWSYPTRSLVHGITLHAKQLHDAAYHGIPITYYHRSGPVGQIFLAHVADPQRAIAVIDLGAGTMACYGLRGQTIDFYERDRELAKTTFDTNEYFTFVEDAQDRGVDVNLILGEPRSSFASKGINQRLKPLRARKDKPTPKRHYGKPIKGDFKYGLIFVDTLRPDALPGDEATKVTRQAVQTYFDRLEKDGVVLIHISSRHFDLQPVLANVAVELGIVGYQWSDEDQGSVGKNYSQWVALARKPEYLAKMLSVPRWTRNPDQLALLGAMAWPSGARPWMQAMTGMCHAGHALMNIQNQKTHQKERAWDDLLLALKEWRPLLTVPELRRIQAEITNEIRVLTAQIADLEKNRNAPDTDKEMKAQLDSRIRKLDGERLSREDHLEKVVKKIQKTIKVGVWADDSFDLLDVFTR
jgi:hypothetical protein